MPRVVSAADLDVARAVFKRWDEAGLAELVPGGLRGDRLPKAADAERPAVYAQLLIKQGPRPNEYSTGGQYIDYRRVTIRLRGVGKAKIAQVHGAIKASLEDPDNPLEIPNAALMRLEPLADQIEQEETTADGDDVCNSLLEWSAWSHRQQ